MPAKDPRSRDRRDALWKRFPGSGLDFDRPRRSSLGSWCEGQHAPQALGSMEYWGTHALPSKVQPSKGVVQICAMMAFEVIFPLPIADSTLLDRILQSGPNGQAYFWEENHAEILED